VFAGFVWLVDSIDDRETRMTRKQSWIGIALLAVFLLCALSAGNSAHGQAAAPAKAGVERSVFGKLDDGTEIELFTLRNTKGSIAKVTTYGAVLTELWMPDRTGKEGDVVLGFDNLQGYLGNHPHFG